MISAFQQSKKINHEKVNCLLKQKMKRTIFNKESVKDVIHMC